MIGRCDQESAEHAELAARSGNWGVDDLPLLQLGSLDAALHNVAYVGGLDAVVRLGRPLQPKAELEEALLAAPPGIAISAAVEVTTEWTWVARTSSVTSLLVDDVAYQDCRSTLETLGVPFRVISAQTPMIERIALAGIDGSLLIERDLIPTGWQQTGAGVQWNKRIWFGRCTQIADGFTLDRPQVLWVAFAPVEDHRGSLADVLGLLGEVGFDLVHLRSLEMGSGQHIFFSAFVCDGMDKRRQLDSTFGQKNIGYRVLAALEPDGRLDEAESLRPNWGRSIG